MDELIFEDNNYKECKKTYKYFIIISIICFLIICYAFIFTILLDEKHRNDTSYIIEFFIRCIYVIIPITICFLKVKKYQLFVYKERIIIKIKTKKYLLKYSRIKSFTFKRFNRFSNFYVFKFILTDEKKYKIYTRYVNEFIEILKTKSNISFLQSNDMVIDSKIIVNNNVKRYDLIGIILAICSVMFSFISISFSMDMTNVKIFGCMGISKYRLLIFSAIVLSLVSFFYNLFFKEKRGKYLATTIISFVCVLIISGFFLAFFVDDIGVEYDYDIIYQVEDKINLDLPNNMEVRYKSYDDYIIIYALINDEEDISKFNNAIDSNNCWSSNVRKVISDKLPNDIITNDAFNYYDSYYMIYNETMDSYSYDSFSEGEFIITFIEYDKNLSRFIIIFNYSINID